MRSVRVLLVVGLSVLLISAGLLFLFGIPMPHPSTKPINDGVACGIDLTMRVNEVECLKRGVNPYLVWSEEVKMPPFTPMIVRTAPNNRADNEYAQLAAYTPWEYSIMLPFSYLPLWLWWYVYLLMDMAILIWIFKNVFFSCSGILQSRHDGMFGCLMLALAVYPLWFDIHVGNYTILILGSMFAMCHCLNCGKKFLAGLLWSLMMVKPQYGLVFAIPFLMKREILTCVVAVITCVGLSIIPSLMCNTPIVDLSLQVKDASMQCFRPCALVPSFVVDYLARMGCSESVAVYLGLGLGATICALFCWKMRFVKDWFVFTLPAVITAVSWSYVLDHGYVLCVLPVFLAVLYYLKYGASLYKLLFLVGLPFVCRFYNLAVIVGHQCNGMFPWLNFSKQMDNALNSYNSLIAMLFMLGFCVLLIRKRVEWLVEKPRA